MSSVTGRIKEVKQPRGGYLKPSDFHKEIYDDHITLAPTENIHSAILGMATDYMVRFMLDDNPEEAFKVCRWGYENRLDALIDTIPDEVALELKKERGYKKLSLGDIKRGLIAINDGDNSADELIERIVGLDDESIVAVCKLVTYDVWLRDPIGASLAKGPAEINPDADTIHNIRTMIQRSVSFWKMKGPITKDGFAFSEENECGKVLKSGYTKTVTHGDGDYLTKDTMWEFKTTRSNITSKHTLQLLMYYIMGKHSEMDIYREIKKIGLFNPRLNVAYTLDVDNIPSDIIETVEKEVICY